MESKLLGYLQLRNPFVYQSIVKWISHTDWGRAKKANLLQDKLRELSILEKYFILLEWKTWEQNTFNLQVDEDNGCTLYWYPSTIVDKDFILCLIKKVECLHMEIEGLLKKWGITPVGERPDGIDWMYVEVADPPCNPNLFRVGKTRGEDYQ